MPSISISKAATLVLQILEKHGGSLGNGKVRDLLIEQAGRTVGPEYYERIKDLLIAAGLVRRGRGRGGSLCLMGDSERADTAVTTGIDSGKPATQPAQPLSSAERLSSLQDSLKFVPGLLVRRDQRNRRDITLLFGNDADKIFAVWDDTTRQYELEYRLEKNKPDHADLVAGLFAQVARRPEDLKRDRRGAQLMAGSTVAGVADLCRCLGPLLDEVCLDNAPANLKTGEDHGPQLIGRGQLPMDNNYYQEVAKFIQLCVKKELRWPLLNWRSALCFDAVDRMVVIGQSPRAREKPYREHIVPVSLIKRQAENLALEDAPTKVIADFIQHHLYVALIHEDEARLLDDSTVQGGKGLKEAMPRNWIWGDNPLARLSEAGIPLVMPHPISPWTPWRKPLRKRELNYP